MQLIIERNERKKLICSKISAEERLISLPMRRVGRSIDRNETTLFTLDPFVSFRVQSKPKYSVDVFRLNQIDHGSVRFDR